MLKQVLLLPLALLICTAPLSAQKDKDDKDDKDKEYLEDPYTKNDKEALLKAGILRTGTFHWADGHNTADIDESLGGADIVWVETAHYRMGFALAEYVVDKGSKFEKAKIKAELKRVAEFLPKMKNKGKKLDPWLRLHMWTMRSEDLYKQIQDILGVTEEDFPTGPGQMKNGRYMGEGPYLGMQNKFNLMFMDKASSLGRYRSGFLGNEGSEPIRHMFPRDGVLFFAVATENDSMTSDTTMHCLFNYAVTMNLLNGYRYYRHALPEWMVVGMAHWIARQVDEKRNYFTRDRVFSEDDKNIWNWKPKVRARVSHEYFPKFTDVVAFKDSENMKYTEHMMSWSRVDYLMATKPEGFRIWMDIMKEPFRDGANITPEMMMERELDALQKGWGLTPEEFDAEWAAWTLKNYPKK
ncbi:MAG: hypothetical protein QF489_05645 [Planctomycetota bacterium]|jgi:hypothetical protein|nr:hypothetical protein [Planctomycetota bacterium]